MGGKLSPTRIFFTLTKGARVAGKRRGFSSAILLLPHVVPLADRKRRRTNETRFLPPTLWIPIGTSFLALGICCYQLSLPRCCLAFTALPVSATTTVSISVPRTRLVHGVLPYRDFDFVQPPGITIVMGPVALLGRVIGTRDAMAVARCLTALVTGLNAGLAALA